MVKLAYFPLLYFSHCNKIDKSLSQIRFIITQFIQTTKIREPSNHSAASSSRVCRGEAASNPSRPRTAPFPSPVCDIVGDVLTKASRYALRVSRSVVVSLSLSRRNAASESEKKAVPRCSWFVARKSSPSFRIGHVQISQRAPATAVHSGSRPTSSAGRHLTG